jgi:hypothetical protein
MYALKLDFDYEDNIDYDDDIASVDDIDCCITKYILQNSLHFSSYTKLSHILITFGSKNSNI